MNTATRREVAVIEMRACHKSQGTLATLQLLAPPHLTREQILTMLSRASSNTDELRRRLEDLRPTAEDMQRRFG